MREIHFENEQAQDVSNAKRMERKKKLVVKNGNGSYSRRKSFS
jgi:hypothetical protein